MRRYARGVTCPVYFIQQLADEIHEPARVAALFDLLETPDKTLHASDGGHTEVPRAVFENAYAFLAEHLR